MEILLWLVPSVVVLVGAMVWASWWGRESRGEVDRDVAIERLARALAKDHPTTRPGGPRRPYDRSTGIAVRPTHGSGGTSGSTRRAS